MTLAHMYDRELNANTIAQTCFAIVVMGILCAVLYFVNLPTTWHLTLVIMVAVVLLSACLAHGFQAVCIQIHSCTDHILASTEQIHASIEYGSSVSPGDLGS